MPILFLIPNYCQHITSIQVFLSWGCVGKDRIETRGVLWGEEIENVVFQSIEDEIVFNFFPTRGNPRLLGAVLLPARFLQPMRGFNILLGSTWLQQNEVLLSVVPLHWFLPSP